MIEEQSGCKARAQADVGPTDPVRQGNVLGTIGIEAAGNLCEGRPASAGDHQRFDRRTEHPREIVQRGLFADHHAAAHHALIKGKVFEVLQQVRLARAEVAGDQQSGCRARGRGVLAERAELTPKPRLHLRLMCAQQAHGIPIGHAGPERFDSPSRVDRVDLERRGDRPEIGWLASLERLAHAAPAMRTREENGFSRLRSNTSSQMRKYSA